MRDSGVSVRRRIGSQALTVVLFLGSFTSLTAQKNQPPPPPVVYSAAENVSNGTLVVGGSGLVLSGTQPVVTLETVILPVISATSTRIDVQLPTQITAGTYLLVVRRGTGSGDIAYFAVAIGENGPRGEQGVAGVAGTPGAVGPQGEAGPQGIPGPAGPQGTAGPQGATGPQGVPGPQGAQGAIGPQGPMGLPGAQGPAGTNGVSGWEMVNVTWNLPAIGSTIGAYAACPAGKKPTGGGWFGPRSDQVAIARDEPDNNAYNVILTNVSSPPGYVRVTVLCVTAQ